MSTAPSTTPASAVNPYVGPRPLASTDPIFGRDREIRELLYLFTAERIVLLYSPSGAGKSSLINARNGLLDRMRPRFDVWAPARVNLPPDRPVPNRYVWSAAIAFEQEVPADRRRPPEALAALTLKEAVETRARKRGAPPAVALVFDQFEEILRLAPFDIPAKREFFRQAGELLQSPDVWALFVIREDYLAQLDPYTPLLPTHLQNRYRLDVLSRGAAMESMRRTALDGGREFTEAAVDKFAADLSQVKVQQPDGSFRTEAGPYVEPLQLQVACRGLWERMPAADLRIDPEDVERFGDVSQALSLYYAGQVARIAAGDIRRERAIREWVGSRLITPEGIRGQVLRGVQRSEGLDNDLVLGLVNCHLVRAEQRGGSVWYELSHDRLIRPIRTDNQAWIDSHLSAVQKQALQWDREQRPERLLATGRALREMENEAARSGDALTALEKDFLAASRTLDRQARRIRRFFAATVVLAIFGVVSAVLALVFLVDATDNYEKERRNMALISQERATAAFDADELDKAWLYTLSALAIALPAGVEMPAALGHFFLPEIRPDFRTAPDVGDLIENGYENPTARVRAVWIENKQPRWVVSLQTEDGRFEYFEDRPGTESLDAPIPGSGEMLFCAAAGDYLAADGPRVFHPRSSRSLTVPGGARVTAMAWSGAEERLGVLSAGSNGRAVVRWAAKDLSAWQPGELALNSPGPEPRLLAFEPAASEQRLIALSDGSSVTLWRQPGSTNGELQPAGRIDPASSVEGLTFLPGGSSLLAVGGADGTVDVWVVGAGDPVRRASYHAHWSGVSFLGASASTNQLLSGGADGFIRVTPLKFETLGQKISLPDLLLKPDGARLKSLLKASSDVLKQTVEDGILRPLAAETEVNEAVERAYSVRPPLQVFTAPGGRLTRAAGAKQWNWQVDGAATAVEFNEEAAGVLRARNAPFQIRLPRRSGDPIAIGSAGQGFLTLALDAIVEPGSVRYGPSRIERLTSGPVSFWRLAAGAREGDVPLKQIVADERLIFIAATGKGNFLVARRGGAVQFAPGPGQPPQPLPLQWTYHESLPLPRTFRHGPAAITYKQVSLNGKKNVVRVRPGRWVDVRALWQLEGKPLGPKPDRVQFYIGLHEPPSTLCRGCKPEASFSKCVANELVAPGYRGISGRFEYSFEAPRSRGLYFLTTSAGQSGKCEPDSKQPLHDWDAAVAAIYVE